MSHFREVLRTRRKRAGLTQQALAEKAGIDHSYVSKMETEEYYPTRDVALSLAAAFGISGQDKFDFLLEARVASKEDVEELEQIDVDDSEVEEDEEQASGTSTYSPAHPSISTWSLPSGTIGGQIERLIAAAGLSEEEEEEIGAALIEITKWRLAYMETQRKMRTEG